MEPTPKRVAVVATGVIGASWAAFFLAHGLDVDSTDPSPDAEARLRAAVAAHWPTLERFGLAAEASADRLRFHARLEDAVADADFVQESGPERLDLRESRVHDAVGFSKCPIATSIYGATTRKRLGVFG